MIIVIIVVSNIIIALVIKSYFHFATGAIVFNRVLFYECNIHIIVTDVQ